MARRRRKKKKGMGTIVFLSLVIALCLMVIFALGKGNIMDTVKDKVTEKVTEQVAQQVIERALENAGDPQAAEKAKEIVANMEEEDKEQALEIIIKYADSQTFAVCMEIVGDGINSDSIEEVQQYLEQSVSEEDMSKLQELYEKYGEQLQQ